MSAIEALKGELAYELMPTTNEQILEVDAALSDIYQIT